MQISLRKLLAIIFLIVLLLVLLSTVLNFLPTHFTAPNNPSDNLSNPTDGSTNQNVEGVQEAIGYINVVPEVNFGAISVVIVCLVAFAVFIFYKRSS